MWKSYYYQLEGTLEYVPELSVIREDLYSAWGLGLILIPVDMIDCHSRRYWSLTLLLRVEGL